ncbi:hypothetical protein SAMN02745857_02622 [Andreprevotia lacus DSM 23236]|jgi:hypothetical protein|uniref:Uncharacterized protein n=1 Tax=Andreprevotia lacus DSM 23236 TaxID=1121001 RepID=A0A1W1XSA8_9NEIS|nr:hypothetical protein [Andreprevotia lacus]SMC26860.1 hypothetical protein SAMN02745857_02622 [Andreprevotia lacus DSM 23236]
MYDCLHHEESTPRLHGPAHAPRHRRWLRLSGQCDLVSQAARHFAALGFAHERLSDGSLLVYDLSVHTALALQQEWPQLIGHYETPLRCLNTTASKMN